MKFEKPQEVVNYDDTDLENEVQEVIDIIEKSEEFEVTEQMEKDIEILKNIKGCEVENRDISNEEILNAITRLQNSLSHMQDNVTTKRVEIVSMFKAISDSLVYILKHIKKWFIGVLVVVFFCGGVVGAVLNANWDNLVPYFDTAFKVTKFLSNTKNIAD